jgi:hypothetical protein
MIWFWVQKCEGEKKGERARGTIRSMFRVMRCSFIGFAVQGFNALRSFKGSMTFGRSEFCVLRSGFKNARERKKAKERWSEGAIHSMFRVLSCSFIGFAVQGFNALRAFGVLGSAFFVLYLAIPFALYSLLITHLY